MRRVSESILVQCTVYLYCVSLSRVFTRGAFADGSRCYSNRSATVRVTAEGDKHACAAIEYDVARL